MLASEIYCYRKKHEHVRAAHVVYTYNIWFYVQGFQCRPGKGQILVAVDHTKSRRPPEKDAINRSGTFFYHKNKLDRDAYILQFVKD